MPMQNKFCGCIIFFLYICDFIMLPKYGLYFLSSLYAYELIAFSLRWGAELLVVLEWTIQIRKCYIWYRLDSVCLNMACISLQ